MKVRPLSPILHPRPRGVGSELLIASSGVVAGGCAGVMVGSSLGRHYGPGLVRQAIPQAWTLVQKGVLSPATALRTYQMLSHPLVQARIGAIGLGTVGAVFGGVLALSLARAQES